jgi:hypothetical protein
MAVHNQWFGVLSEISESDVEKMMEYGFTNNSNRQINVNPAEY